ncbi:MAG: hypothetical protein K2M79_06400, partial [Muribaculaceae bacterium]|nr:hypothetical protein [Muribaculaceae bacterium]
FSEALDAGAYVEEFYRFNPGTEPDGSLSVALNVVFPDMVKLESMKVNEETFTNLPDNNNKVYTGIPAQYVKTIEMNYSVFGVPFTTTYSEGDFSGVETVVADGDSVPAEYYDLKGVRVTTPSAGNIYVEKRGSSVKKVLL